MHRLAALHRGHAATVACAVKLLPKFGPRTTPANGQQQPYNIVAAVASKGCVLHGIGSARFSGSGTSLEAGDPCLGREVVLRVNYGEQTYKGKYRFNAMKVEGLLEEASTICSISRHKVTIEYKDTSSEWIMLRDASFEEDARAFDSDEWHLRITAKDRVGHVHAFEASLKTPAFKDLPAIYAGSETKFVDREQACIDIDHYIKSCIKEERSADGKFSMLGTAGMPGIGKTALLLHAARNLPKVEGHQMKSLYFSFSGLQGGFSIYNEMRSATHNVGDAFGRALVSVVLHNPPNLDEKTLAQCIQMLCNIAGCSLVIFIDEIGQLDTESSTKLLKLLLHEMDAQHGRVVFIFSHLQKEMLMRQVSESGRSVQSLTLPALSIENWRDVLPTDWVDAAVSDSGVNQLVLSCMGHPRCLTDGLKEAAKESNHLLKNPSLASLNTARMTIVRTCRLDTDLSHLANSWFDVCSTVSEVVKRVQAKNLLVSLPVKSGDQFHFLHPLALQAWALKDTSLLASHLTQAYDADAVLAPSNEKSAEAILYNYEAVLRAACTESFTLGKFYGTKHIDNQLSSMVVTVKAPNATSLVVPVKTFENNFAQTLEFLTAGFIVVSENTTEPGIEYLSPYFDAKGNLVIAAVQCRCIVGSTLGWGTIKAGIRAAMRQFDIEAIKWFPVVYTTSSQRTIRRETYAGSVFFTESDLFVFTQKMGALRLHTTKFDSNDSDEKHWLRNCLQQQESLTPT